MADVKQFIFFDFEMLCSNKGMPFEDMEAIRLGAVKYNIETEDIEFFDRYIQPTKRVSLSRFCTELTGIKDTDLVGASNFKNVFEDFLTWIGGIKKIPFFLLVYQRFISFKNRCGKARNLSCYYKENRTALC
ncbi:exonuclease domain-containing protein [Priestia megaterium]|uniref:exonuclease domain-containing protein n=1 Tax=Priestia megaterium TaxID=1404 RepID=UPI001EDA89C8|nr:exonuclease domain-containing protein [Priestia megaterium]